MTGPCRYRGRTGTSATRRASDSSAGVTLTRLSPVTDARGQWRGEPQAWWFNCRLRQDRGRRAPGSTASRRDVVRPALAARSPSPAALYASCPGRSASMTPADSGPLADEILAELRSLIDLGAPRRRRAHPRVGDRVRVGDHCSESASGEFTSGLHELGILGPRRPRRSTRRRGVLTGARRVCAVRTTRTPILPGPAVPGPRRCRTRRWLRVPRDQRTLKRPPTRRRQRRLLSRAAAQIVDRDLGASRPPGSAQVAAGPPPPWGARPSPSATQRCWCPSRPG